MKKYTSEPKGRKSMAKTRRKSASSTKRAPFPYTTIFSLFFILLGAGILVWTSFQKISFPSVYIPKPSSTPQSLQMATIKPTKLYIPRLSKILYVTDGRVEGNRWEISETGVSYYTASSLPGQGNTVLYGHNKMDILGDLPQLAEGDTIYLVMANGNFVKYQVSQTKQVEPTQVEILQNTPDTRLTIYTCTGFLDTARFVVVAKSTPNTI